MANSHLVVTDGTTSIDLLGARGWSIKSWFPEIAQPKGGGIFRSSPLVDGRRLSMRKFDNPIETLTMVLADEDQDSAIYELQELMRLLQKATEYWTSNWQNEPVWLEAQGPRETERRYAIIMDYRLTGMNNPYAQPFFGPCTVAAMDNMILAIERGHWQDIIPGNDGTCAKVSSQYEIPVTISNTTVRGADTYDDTTYCYQSTVIYSLYDYLVVGYPDFTIPEMPYGASVIGLRFDPINIPNGTHITRATLTMRAAATTAGADNLTVQVVGHDPVLGDAGDFNQTKAQFLTRWQIFTSHKTWWVIPQTVNNTDYSTDVTAVVQEIIDHDNWDSGDAMVLFVIPTGLEPAEVRWFYDYNAAPGEGPSMYIEYAAAPETVGDDPTCLNTVYIGNKSNRGAITHLYHYDDSTTTFSGELLGAATPFALLPAVPAVDDCVYFGSCNTLLDYGPIFNIVFDIGTASADIVGVWEYYDSGTMSALPSIVRDNPRGVALALDHLASLGHTHVTYLAGPETSWADGIRWRSVRDLAPTWGMSAQRIGPSPPTFEGGRSVAAYLQQPTTCVIAYNDLMAVGLITELADTRRRVPEDIAVVGFDDIPAARLVRPALTTIATPLDFMGEVGMRNLIALINGAQHHNPAGLVLPVQLKIRGSTGHHRARHAIPAPRRAVSNPSGPTLNRWDVKAHPA